MSFTPEQKLAIAKIVPMTPTLLNAHLDSLGDDLTEEVVTAVAAELAAWDGGVGQSFASFTPTESNQGFNLKAHEAKNAIRRNIRTLLEIDAPGNFGGPGTLCVSR